MSAHSLAYAAEVAVRPGCRRVAGPAGTRDRAAAAVGQRPAAGEALATRYDKLAITYRAAVVLSACITWTRV